MRIFDKKVIELNNGRKNMKILVYLKEVNVRNKHTSIKSFSKILVVD